MYVLCTVVVAAVYTSADPVLASMMPPPLPPSQVAAISGSGQQHGSVYWRTGAASALAKLAKGATVSQQLGAAKAFALDEAPIWADSSTKEQCVALEKSLGGPQAVAALTGSRY